MSFDVEITVWNKSRELLQGINPILCEIIDKIAPDKTFKLIKLRAPFGDLIVDSGKFNINSYGHQDLVSYSPIPLFIVLSKNLEVFVVNNGRVIPLNMIQEGAMVGSFETVDALFEEHSSPSWSVCSGARSLFLLPRITDQLRHKNLRMQYGLTNPEYIRKLQDHWFLLKMLAQSSRFKQEWYSEVLIFTTSWFDKKRNDSKEWTAFYDYIFKSAWHILNYALVKFNIEMLWEGFVNAISDRRLKPHQYISDHIKHLLMMGAGRWPGFISAGNSQAAAPVQEFIAESYLVRLYNRSV